MYFRFLTKDFIVSNFLTSIADRLPKIFTKDNIKDALRLALQSSIAAAACFFLLKTFNISEVFLGVLSAVLVVERSIGNTINHAKGRIFATIVGSGIGFIFVSLIPFGYATVVSLIITMFVMNAIASFKPSWRYGVVASVAISLGADGDALSISIDRLIAIGIGITIGLVATAIIWPETARKRTSKHLRRALKTACDRFKIAFKNSRTEDNDDASETADNFHTSLGKAKDASASIKFGDKEKYLNLIDCTEKLYNSILIIHRVADSTDTTMLSEGDASIANADKLNEQTCDIVDALIKDEPISIKRIETFNQLIEDISSNILGLEDDPDQKLYRNAFVFGIKEIQESLMILKDLNGN